MTEETLVWRGSSSPWLYVRTYALCALIFVVVLGGFGVWYFFGNRPQSPMEWLWPALGLAVGLLVPLGLAFSRWMLNKFRIYEITTQRIRVLQGIFTRRTEELELYRVHDLSLVEPFWLRLAGAGHLVLSTYDTSSPTLTLEALPKVQVLRESLRVEIEACRERKKVRMTEME